MQQTFRNVVVLWAACATTASAFQPGTTSTSLQRRNHSLRKVDYTTTKSSPTALNLSFDDIISVVPTDALASLSLSISQIQLPSSLAEFAASVPTPVLPALILFSGLYSLSFPEQDFIAGNEPYLRGNYDPVLARQFYSKNPLLVIKRSLQLLRLSNSFLFNLSFDKYILKDSEKNIEQRANELLQLIQKIGPTAIKVGQALSVRSDLIPAEYAKALSELQDNVPPFDSKQAQELLKSELGDKFSLLKEIDLDKPVASASIGQVYRGYAEVDNFDSEGNLKGKKQAEVAIKVQRPNVLAEIALDLFIVREFAPYYQKITGSATDLQALANEWGRGFIAELTYDGEAKNTKNFNKAMKEKGLNAVTAPVVVDELSTNRILTTEWVRGNRLDRSAEDDVPRLCSVALNAYLVMLLETGTLHCDRKSDSIFLCVYSTFVSSSSPPRLSCLAHPGNLLRTEDGRLCILDFGMTLETPPSLQYALLEFIAHLTAENFDEVPQDLIKLQFVKEEKVDLLVKSGSLEPLYYFLKQANQGGGGKKVRERIYEEYRQKYPGADDEEIRTYMRAEIKEQGEKMAEKASAVTGISMKVEDLQRENSGAFTIPEWFLYTSRAFLTLEGISLQADPDFSITQSCFPYVAKRLIGDDSPRSQAALRELIYGKNDQINIEKCVQICMQL
jgi:predicted unusual protein kinase regulating ubiquinone biosynthesis (AarF/ABC1/UbiB family)